MTQRTSASSFARALTSLAGRAGLAALVATLALAAGCSDSVQPITDVIVGADVPVSPDLPAVQDMPRTDGPGTPDNPQPQPDMPQPTDMPEGDSNPPPDGPPPADTIEPDLNVDMASGEICDNGSDDDGDGFTDCADRECSGASSGTPAANCDRGTVHIQDIQDGTYPSGMATVQNVFVTGLRASGTNGRQLYVQEADGVTTAGHTYPEFAGITVFIPDSASANFPELGSVQVGDCLTIRAVIEEFQMATQLTFVQSLTKNASGCGTAPQPATVAFADVASDLDPDMGGRQPGANAERYESVLIAVATVSATSATSATAADGGAGRFSFFVTDGTPASLFVDNLLFTPRGPITSGGDVISQGETFSRIVGIYGQNTNGYFVSPRDESDVVQ